MTSADLMFNLLLLCGADVPHASLDAFSSCPTVRQAVPSGTERQAVVELNANCLFKRFRKSMSCFCHTFLKGDLLAPAFRSALVL